MKTVIKSEAPYREKPDLSKFVLVLIFVLVVGLAFYLRTGKKYKETSVAPPVEVQPGVLSLATKEAKSQYNAGETVNLLVNADTAGKTIKGFDVVLNYDPKTVRYQNAVSMIDDMQIVAVDLQGKLTVTGFKRLDRRDAKITLSGKPAVELTFVTLKGGEVNFELVHEIGSSRKSNLVSETGRQLLGKAEGTKLEIK